MAPLDAYRSLVTSFPPPFVWTCAAAVALHHVLRAFLGPVTVAAILSRASRIFSHTRGTPRNTVGRTCGTHAKEEGNEKGGMARLLC